MPEWVRFGYGVELDEVTAKEIGMKLNKNEEELYENSQIEWKEHEFSMTQPQPLDGRVIMMIGAYESMADSDVHTFNLAELLQKHAEKKDLDVMHGFLQIYAPTKRAAWLMVLVYDA